MIRVIPSFHNPSDTPSHVLISRSRPMFPHQLGPRYEGHLKNIIPRSRPTFPSHVPVPRSRLTVPSHFPPSCSHVMYDDVLRLHSIFRSRDDTDDTLLRQVGVFDKEKSIDTKQYADAGIDINCLMDVFMALYTKVKYSIVCYLKWVTR